MKYYHSLHKNKLTQALTPSDKFIRTEDGDFKIRKNGKIILIIDAGNDNEEAVRVTPLQNI